MFSGIIEEIAPIIVINKKSQSLELLIKLNKIKSALMLGDSLAINGVCLTVTKIDYCVVYLDVMPETYKTTNLVNLKIGSLVNVERALSVNARLNGHLVTGHVDGLAKIIKIENKQIAKEFSLHVLNPALISYCLTKGSISCDGVSLTIIEVGSNWLKVGVIPHSYQNTIIKNWQINNLVNIECDYLVKIMIEKKPVKNKALVKPSKINQAFLAENGFI